ncbi:MAG: right-handed parallel beta-helix repeat-containing protein [Kiritimatiellae bacterium]|nr:right-handed parallel beta-helix repeat-containing protein [Kiritimatiellia bacterium]
MNRISVGFVASLLVGLLAHAHAHAADYFFDSQSGADSNAGTQPTAAFKTLEKLAALSLEPGDTVHLKRGSEFRGQLRFKGDGLEGRPIRLTAYGTGPKPEILATVRPAAWERHDGDVYKVRLPAETFTGDRFVYGVFDYPRGGLPVYLEGNRRARKMPDGNGRFFFDAETMTLYVRTHDGKPPAEHALEVSVVTPLLGLAGRSWLAIDNIAFLFGNRSHWVFRDSHDIVIRDCASLYVSHFGNAPVSIGRQSHHIQLLNCFLYENCNGGVCITDGATRNTVRGCTIVKCRSNDGITCHSGGKDKNGVRQGITGDHNVLENNVIGHCPEESIDITSGDHHIVRGNICYGNGNPGIIVGHDSDHILIQNNICFGNRRAGIHVAGTAEEGARGHNTVVRNLVYDNGYPGLEIQAPYTKVLNNTVVNSRQRVAVRITEKATGSDLRNNLIVTTDRAIYHPSLQFMSGTPTQFGVTLSHNLFFHLRKPDGRVLQTKEGNFAPADFLAKYRTGQGNAVQPPQFREEGDLRYFLAPGSPGVDAGADVGLPFKGRAPDAGWKEVGDEAAAPPYPPFLIGDGENDEAEILYLWGKTEVTPKKKRWTAAPVSARAGNDPAVPPSEFEAALQRIREYRKKPGLAIHYVELARALAGEDAGKLARVDEAAAEVK